IERFINRSAHSGMDKIAQCGNVFLGQSGKVHRVVKMDRDFRGPEHPVACGVMLKRADDADGHEWDVELLREAECAEFEFAHSAIACALAFRKDDEAHAAVDGVFGETP